MQTLLFFILGRKFDELMWQIKKVNRTIKRSRESKRRVDLQSVFLVVHRGGNVPEVILTKQNKLLGEEGRASLKQGPACAVLPPQCSLFHGSSNSWSLCYDSATTHSLCRPSGQLSYCTSQYMCELVHSQDLMLETF